MKSSILIAIYLIATMACAESGSPKQKEQDINGVGGRCEGCEAIHESPIPFDKLPSIDTLPGFENKGDRIFISGTVYKKDGKTPAEGVIIYVYHTDQSGNYPTKGDEKGWDRRHGYLRGWMRSGADGKYGFYTLRPASYPNSTNPQHIHVTIKEPRINEYWIDEYHFEDDPLLTQAVQMHAQDRGGNGIIKLEKKDDLSTAKRDIVLGLNIPGYPD